MRAWSRPTQSASIRVRRSLPAVLLRQCANCPPGRSARPLAPGASQACAARWRRSPGRTLDELEGLVEEQFIRRCYLGASIAALPESLSPIQVGRALEQRPAARRQTIQSSTSTRTWRLGGVRPKSSGRRTSGARTHAELCASASTTTGSSVPSSRSSRIASSTRKSGNRITACRLDDARARSWTTSCTGPPSASTEEGQYLDRDPQQRGRAREGRAADERGAVRQARHRQVRLRRSVPDVRSRTMNCMPGWQPLALRPRRSGPR